MNGRANPRSAFTLLEMVLAMGLMTVLAASLYSSLSIAYRAQEAADRAVAPVRRAALAIDAVRSEFLSALPPTGLLAGSFIGEDEKGNDGDDADTVVFHATGNGTDNVRPASDIRRIELAVDDNHCLVRRVTGNLLSPETVDPVQTVVCRGVRAFNLTYYDGSDWYDEWDSTTQDNALPMAVEVMLEVDRPHVEATYTLSSIVRLPCYALSGTQTRIIRSSGMGGGGR